MELTQEQYAIMAHVYADPDVVWENVVRNNSYDQLLEFLELHRVDYLFHKDDLNYETRAQENQSVLKHCLVDPDAWVAHATATVGEWAVEEKINKYRDDYLKHKYDDDYQTRAEREVPPEPTQAQIKQSLINAIQSYLDKEAQAHFYDGILSLCSYATSTNLKFGPEGQAGVVWRDDCWSVGYAVLAECEAGTRAIPTVDELLAEMPAMVWP